MSADSSDTVFTGPFEREARVSADGQMVTHRAMAWSMTYTPETLPKWIAFYERMATNPTLPRAQVDVELLHKAEGALAKART